MRSSVSSSVFTCLFIALTGLLASCANRSDSVTGSGGTSVSIAPIQAATGGDSVDDSFFTEDLGGVTGKAVADPFRGFNRTMFRMNDRIYQSVLRPVSRGYTAVVPDPVEKGLGNIFKNITFPKRFVGNLLQGKWEGAARETGQFVFNTTTGLGGILDAAGDVEILRTPDDEDLGQAFASWGIGAGPYLVMPLFGPYTLRSGVGRVGEIALNPVNHFQDAAVPISAQSLDYMNLSPELLNDYDTMIQGAIDPYVSMKDAYTQFRESKLKR